MFRVRVNEVMLFKSNSRGSVSQKVNCPVAEGAVDAQVPEFVDQVNGDGCIKSEAKINK